jgi:hypothetical protein
MFMVLQYIFDVGMAKMFFSSLLRHYKQYRETIKTLVFGSLMSNFDS